MVDRCTTGAEAAVIGVIAEENILPRKIELLLGAAYTVIRTKDGEESQCHLLIRANYGGRIPVSITLSRNERNLTLPYPFSYDELREKIRAMASGETAVRQRLLIESDGRHVILDGEKIRLTESEHKLLSLIAAGDGELVSREELTLGTFGEGADGGILNVYIHYLREKLEGRGERIILSSRRGGYRIDKKYLGGDR